MGGQKYWMPWYAPLIVGVADLPVGCIWLTRGLLETKLLLVPHLQTRCNGSGGRLPYALILCHR